MKQVLLAEDDSDDQLFFSTAWNEIAPDARLIIVPSAEEALKFLNDTTELPAICVFDINMPGSSGIDLLKTVRSNPRFNDIHIAMLTTSSDSRTANVCFGFGANAFYTKPGSHSLLVKTVERILFNGLQG